MRISDLDLATGYGASLILALLVLALCICCARSESARFKAERDARLAKAAADLANEALRRCQTEMLRGSSIMRHRRPHAHRSTDPVVEVIYAEGTGLAFRDAALRDAKAFYREIEHELPPHK